MTFINPFHKTLCPYCFERFYLADCDIVASIDVPQKNISRNAVVEPRPTGLRKVLSRVWLPSLKGPKYTSSLAARRCPNCSNLLPHNIEYMDNQIIGMIGGTLAGKSHYIASLVKQIEQERVLDGFGCIEFSPISDEVSRRYQEEYHDFLYQKREPIPKTQPVQDFIKPLVYVLVFRRQHKWPPLKRVNLILFDAPGEEMDSRADIAQITRYIVNAAGLIFLVDPLTIPGIFEQLPCHLRQNSGGIESFRILDGVLQVWRRYHGVIEGSPVQLPLAIAISKADLLKYVVENLGTQSVFLKQPYYDGRYRNLDIPQINDEVQELLQRYNGGALISKSAAFSKKVYLAVSATGCAPDGSKTPPQFPFVRPIRCVDPLIWLLAQLGVIETEEDNEQ